MSISNLTSDLLSILKSRWLKSVEIYELLKNCENLLSKNLLTPSINPPINPKNGDIFVYRIHSNWRKDNINWDKRKSRTGTNESSLIIKIKGEKLIYCTYNKSANLKRRSYRLTENGQVIIVHYLSEFNQIISEHNSENQFIRKRERFDNENPCLDEERETSKIQNLLQNQLKTNLFLSPHVDHPFTILDFAPEVISDFSHTKVITVFKTNFSFEILKNIENDLKIKIGSFFVSCRIISSSSLSFMTPLLEPQESTLSLFINGDRYSSETKQLIHIKQSLSNEYTFRDKNKSTGNKNQFMILSFNDKELKHKINRLIENYICRLESKIITDKEKLKIIKKNNETNENYVNSFLDYYFLIISNLKKDLSNSINNILYLQDECGYNLLHYICGLNYFTAVKKMIEHNYRVFTKSKDGLTAYEISAAKCQKETLTLLIDEADKKELKDLYFEEKINSNSHIEILKNGLNLAIENGKVLENKDIKILELLLKQIKFEYTVDSTSGSIVNTLNNNFENNMDENKKEKGFKQEEYIPMIQKYVRGWIKRSKYTGIKQAANTLKLNMKNFLERKKFNSMRKAVLVIQKNFRSWIHQKN